MTLPDWPSIGVLSLTSSADVTRVCFNRTTDLPDAMMTALGMLSEQTSATDMPRDLGHSIQAPMHCSPSL